MNLDDLTEEDAKVILDRWARSLGYKNLAYHMSDEILNKVCFGFLDDDYFKSMLEMDAGKYLSNVTIPCSADAYVCPYLNGLRKIFETTCIKRHDIGLTNGMKVILKSGTTFEEFMIMLDLNVET